MNARTESAELNFTEHRAGNRYCDRRFAVEAVKVPPGEYYASTSNMVTVLGCCVSARIRDREKNIGGMNHFMLAKSFGGGRALVKKLMRLPHETLIRCEKEYAARRTEAPISGDIESS